jgi:hypothetical protein
MTRTLDNGVKTRSFPCHVCRPPGPPRGFLQQSEVKIFKKTIVVDPQIFLSDPGGQLISVSARSGSYLGILVAIKIYCQRPVGNNFSQSLNTAKIKY